LGMEKKVDVSGRIIYRGRWYNLDFNDDSKRGSLNRKNVYGDLTLTVKFRPAEGVKGCFEFYKQVYGTGRMQYNTIQTGETVTNQDWQGPDLARNEDENWEMTLIQAWGQVDLPFAPVSLKVGRQPLLLSDNGLYLNTGISKTFAILVDADLPFADVRLGTAKLYEGVRQDDDDADINFVSVKKEVAGHKLGCFMAFYKDLSSAFAAPTPTTVDSMERRTTNVGITANGKLGPVKYKAEFDYMFGQDKSNKPGRGDVDIAGYMLMAGVQLPPLGKVCLGLEFGMGSGDDVDTPDKNEAYIPPGPFYPYAWAYEYRFIHWIWNSSRFRRGTVGVMEALAPGLENTIYAKVGAKWKLNKWLSGANALVYMMAEKSRPIQKPDGTRFDPGKNIGLEVDTILNLNLHKNFSYQFILGYVIPGNFFDGRIKGFDAAGNPIEADPAWGIRSQFAFTF